MRAVLMTTFVAAGFARVATAQFAYTATVLTAGQGNNTQFNAFPTDINNDGLISGYTINPNSTDNDTNQAVSWTGGFGYELNTRVQATSFYGFGRATGVSSNGLVSGFVQNNNTNGNYGGFVQYGGVGSADPQAAAGDLIGRGIVRAFDVNAEGRVVGVDAAGQLVTFKPGPNAQVQTVAPPSPDGRFVVGSPDVRPPFVINDRNVVAGTLLTGPEGETRSEGYAIAVAPVAGEGGDFIPSPRLFGNGTTLAGLNDSPTPTYTGRGEGGATVFFPQTGPSSATANGLGVANDVNDRNVVVGRGIVTGGEGLTGFVSFNGFAVDLNKLVNLNGLGINTTSIREAVAINDRGQIVVRTGGSQRDGYALVLTPIQGTSQFTPRLPDSQAGAVSSFVNVQSGQWFDPVGDNALTYTMTGGGTFDAILELPQGFEGISLTVDGITTDLAAGGAFDFGAGVTNFTVNWSGPNQVDFPVRLAFSGATASFTIAAVPEPTAVAALGLTGVGLLRRRRV